MTSELKSGGEGDGREEGGVVEVGGIFKRESMARAAFLMKEQGRQAWEGQGGSVNTSRRRYVWSLLLLFVFVQF